MIKIKHVIWDWNGTLINDAWLFVELMNEELYSRNLPQINVDEYRQYFTFPVKKYYEALGFDFEKEDFKEVGYNFIQKFKQRKFEANLFEDSIDILEYFKNLNIKQSIVSAQEHKLLNQTITIELVMANCTNISFQIFEQYTLFLKQSNITDAIFLFYHLHDKGYSVMDILDNYFLFVKTSFSILEADKYKIIPFICKYITAFHNIHEDEIELALFSNNLKQILKC